MLKKYNLVSGSLNQQTVRTQADCNNAVVYAESRTSPMEAVEPFIVEYCIRLARIGQPLTKKQVISLATLLIKDTETEIMVIKWKTNMHPTFDPSAKDFLGHGWYQGFVHRFVNKIKRAKARMHTKTFTTCTVAFTTGLLRQD